MQAILILKMKKKYKSMIEQGRVLLVLLSIAFLIYCVMRFFLAFHNIDLSWNFLVVTSTLNNAGIQTANGTRIVIPFEQVTDFGSDFLSRPLVVYYTSSANDLRKYFILGLLDCLLLGLLLNGRKK